MNVVVKTTITVTLHNAPPQATVERVMEWLYNHDAEVPEGVFKLWPDTKYEIVVKEETPL